MGVHQPGDQHVLAEIDFLIGGEAGLGGGARQQRLDDTVAQGDAMVFENRAGGLDRDDPAGTEKADLGHGFAVNSNRAT